MSYPRTFEEFISVIGPENSQQEVYICPKCGLEGRCEPSFAPPPGQEIFGALQPTGNGDEVECVVHGKMSWAELKRDVWDKTPNPGLRRRVV